VSGHKAGDLPTDPTEPRLHRKTITIEISPEGYDVWRRMHALAAEEHGQRLSDNELIQSVFRRAYDDGANAGGKAGDQAGSPPCAVPRGPTPRGVGDESASMTTKLNAKRNGGPRQAQPPPGRR